ncbi:hypothetical protein M408DRAFT_261131 [Serendipita vermifera MAFF 305830]|uniref:Uncharacterized protein n=1 Tax=Serendipita vermifera MAFF 305830 TaxID=933852 RepID=A0A0C2XRH7_SERVB|nr:hypothetical protein M408DRAFT_261131 [Serendipita vermifera MAFF 305830]
MPFPIPVHSTPPLLALLLFFCFLPYFFCIFFIVFCLGFPSAVYARLGRTILVLTAILGRTKQTGVSLVFRRKKTEISLVSVVVS